MAERGDSSEDSPKAYQQDGTITAVETTSDPHTFDDLMKSHRSMGSKVQRTTTKQEDLTKSVVKETKVARKPPSVDEFDVVASPDVIMQEMEEEKGAII